MASPVGGHEDLDVPSGVKPVQLVNQLQHSTLHFIGTTITITKPGAWRGGRGYICRQYLDQVVGVDFGCSYTTQ